MSAILVLVGGGLETGQALVALQVPLVLVLANCNGIGLIKGLTRCILEPMVVLRLGEELFV